MSCRGRSGAARGDRRRAGRPAAGLGGDRVWAAAAKLGVISEMIRREAPFARQRPRRPAETWSPSLRYELAGALACSTQSAETIASLAWQLQARLPGIGALLDDGTLTFPKAGAVAEHSST